MSEVSPRQTQRLVLVHTEPNTEAALLEKHLGIEFPVIPAKVPYTFLNALSLHTINRIGLDILDYFSQVTEFGARGRYLRKHNSFLYSRRDEEKVGYPVSLVIPFHENLHGFFTMVSPKVAGSGGIDIRRLFASAMRGKVYSQDVSTDEASLSFEEGFCDWGAWEAVFREALDITEPVLGHYTHRKSMLVTAQLDEADDYEAFIAEAYEHLDMISSPEYFGQRLRMIQDKQMGVRDLKKELAMINSARYRVGHHFMNEVMSRFLSNPIYIGDALRLVVANPPTSLDELKNPENYYSALVSI